ncbi:MAG: Cu/Ag efflux pump CusA [Porticoccus sp.]|jgi:Cu/Ag efflux pump CusA
MNSIITATDLAMIIQLSVAPVFLLAGIAGFLNVMSGRLGRIVDRARVVERREARLSDPAHQLASHRELVLLWRRSDLINWAIGLCTASGLLVCTLIVSLFVGGFWGLNIAAIIVGMFVLAMMVLIVALMLFMKEVQLAKRTLGVAREFSVDEANPKNPF